MNVKQAALVCLVASGCIGSAHAQFGRLKDLANKVKKPDLGVTRKAAPTPYVTSSDSLMAGETKDITVKVQRFDATQFDRVNPEEKNCLKINSMKAVAPTELKLNVTVLADADDSSCGVTLESTAAQQVAYVRWSVEHPKPEKFTPDQVTPEVAFAKTWELSYPGGKHDTWTRGKKIEDDTYEYLSSSGEKLKFRYNGYLGNIETASKCSYMASFRNDGTAQFLPYQYCAVPVGTVVKATSTK